MTNIAAQLAQLEQRTLLRKRRVIDSPCGVEVTVDGKPMIAFASNDYLGLANHPAIIEAACEGARKYGVGAGASHLVSGHYTPHEELEERLAQFVRLPRALYFSTGYMANLAVLPAFAGRGDSVFCDKLNHASLIDAARLSRADVRVYPHADENALREQLAASKSPRKLIVTDAVFSMDGDLAPLPALLELAQEFGALLVVDDAHGFGVLGRNGQGALTHLGIDGNLFLYIGTLGKAAGVSGAFVAGSAENIEWLMQRGRSYVFTTATPPMIACALLASLDLIEQGAALRDNLDARIRQLRSTLKLRRWRLSDSPTAIQPIIIGDNAATMAAMQALHDQGLWVPAIRPPTVPAGQARLRISLSAQHTEAHVAALVDALNRLDL